MKRESGFTLVETIVVMAILGILGATAVPVYHTWQQRAYGREATLMAQQIIEGEILYYLEHDSFFPPEEEETVIYIDSDNVTSETEDDIDYISQNLKITIPTSHHLKYTLINNIDNFTITIEADFPLFKNGVNILFGYLDESGETYLL